MKRRSFGRLMLMGWGLMLVALAAANPLEGYTSDRQQSSTSGLRPEVWLPLVARDRTGGVASHQSKKGVGLACDPTAWRDVAQATGAHWFYDWSVSHARRAEGGARYVPMVRTKYSSGDLTAFASEYPGSYWLVGNEPNVLTEDNLPPEEAARGYSALCAAVLRVDPSAKCVVGGVLNEPWYMDEMLAYWPSTVPIAGLHWHYYGWGSDATDVSLLRQAADRYVAFTQAQNPNWETWLTEFGVIGSGAENLAENEVTDFIVGAVTYLDAKEGLARYSWFAWQKCTWQDFSVAELAYLPYAEAYRSASGN